MKPGHSIRPRSRPPPRATCRANQNGSLLLLSGNPAPDGAHTSDGCDSGSATRFRAVMQSMSSATASAAHCIMSTQRASQPGGFPPLSLACKYARALSHLETAWLVRTPAGHGSAGVSPLRPSLAPLSLAPLLAPLPRLPGRQATWSVL